jgi:hypothetical protein
MLITVVSLGGRYGSDAPMFAVPAIASATPVPDPEEVGCSEIELYGGLAAHSWKSGVNSEEPFSVNVVDDEGGFSRPFRVFSRADSVGVDDFGDDTCETAPETGASAKVSAIAPAATPAETATNRDPSCRLPMRARNIMGGYSFQTASSMDASMD